MDVKVQLAVRTVLGSRLSDGRRGNYHGQSVRLCIERSGIQLIRTASSLRVCWPNPNSPAQRWVGRLMEVERPYSAQAEFLA